MLPAFVFHGVIVVLLPCTENHYAAFLTVITWQLKIIIQKWNTLLLLNFRASILTNRMSSSSDLQ
ncbi:MAG: hypothetical protein JWQ09_4784 [Segetibacter sp.]|nr:hypothetical protein [Segetibacter sp.]